MREITQRKNVTNLKPRTTFQVKTEKNKFLCTLTQNIYRLILSL